MIVISICTYPSEMELILTDAAAATEDMATSVVEAATIETSLGGRGVVPVVDGVGQSERSEGTLHVRNMIGGYTTLNNQDTSFAIGS